MMKRIAWLFVAALCSVTLVQAQSSGKAMEMQGTICRSACVTSTPDNVATCNRDCTVTTGDAVFIGDNGTVAQIAQESQDMCQSHMGKHVTMKAKPAKAPPTEQEREQQILLIQNLRESGAG